MNSRIVIGAKALGLAAAYYLSGSFGLSLASVHASVTPVWPPTGLALAALVLWGRKLWPGVLLGAFLVNYKVQGSVSLSLAIALGNTLEAVLGCWITQEYAEGQKAFDRTNTIFRYVLLTAMLSTMASSMIGVTSLCIGQSARWDNYAQIWLTWWLGDMVSDLIVAPFVFIWMGWPFPKKSLAKVLEPMGLLLLVVFVGSIVFLGRHPFGAKDYPLEYLAIPPLLWASFRFCERGAVTFALVMSIIALWGTRDGSGPFARPDPNESLLLLQTFMGTITITALVLGSMISERNRAEGRLQMQDAVSRILADAATLKEATPRLFQALYERRGWEVGAMWRVDSTENRLICVELWHTPSLRIPQFETVTRQTRFAPGVGLPGRVWTCGSPVGLADVTRDSNFPRAHWALQEGLRAGVCFPIKLGGHVLGVIECFSRQVREPDEHSLQMLTVIGNQLGQFMERKRAEEMRTRLADLVETSEDAIISNNLEGQITSWNAGAERLFGYTAGEMIGQPLARIIPPERLEDETTLLKRLRSGENVHHFETIRYAKNRFPVNVSLTISPIRDGSGALVGASNIARDITQRKTAEAALAQAQEVLRRHAEELERRVQERTANLEETIRSLDSFCYSIAHDLRAPLRAIGGFSNELWADYADKIDDLGKDYLRRMKESASRMDKLILDLLELGRLSTIELTSATIELRPLITRALVPLESTLQSRRAQVEIKEPLLTVRGSPVILEQVLVNLLGNGLKFVAPEATPRLEVWTETHASRVRILIQDNGIGMKPEHLKKIFQPFVRLVNGADYPGTGIGLAIVRRGTERMGGTVGVHSEPGKGSRFWIELPAGNGV